MPTRTRIERVARAVTALLAAGGALCAGAAAVQTYPVKPVRVIVPYAPGGGNDLIARILGQALAEQWGQAVVIDNRPGAGSTLGVHLATKAAADGYTLVITASSLAASSALYRKLPYDIERDLSAVVQVADQPNLLVVHPKVAATSMGELITLAKAKPGALTYASSGTGSGVHLAGELLRSQAGIDMRHVPYKGTGPALNDLIGGQVDMLVSTMASALPHVATNRLRALAVTTAKRSAAAPNIPTVAESGVPGYEYSTWYGFHGPAGLARPLVERLNTDFGRALQRADVKSRFAAAGVEAVHASARDYAAFVSRDVAKWAKVVKQAGIAAVD